MMRSMLGLLVAGVLMLPCSVIAQATPVPEQTARAEAASSGGRPSTSVRPALDSAELDARTRELAAELRCPVCQGESIQESPSELAQEMKALVRDQLAAGKTPDEIKAYFVGSYGEWILLRPTTSGFNAMLYWLPPFALLVGVGIVIMLARRWTRANATSAVPEDHVG